MVQSAQGFAARTGDPMEVVLRRLERLEKNVSELGRQVDSTLDKFQTAEKQKMGRMEALNQLIRAIAQVHAA